MKSNSNSVMQNATVPPNAKSANEMSDPSEPVHDTNNLPSCSGINTDKTSSNTSQGESEPVEVSEYTSDYMSEIGHSQLCTDNETENFSSTVTRSISEELTPIKKGKSNRKRNRIESLSPDSEETVSKSTLRAKAVQAPKRATRANV